MAEIKTIGKYYIGYGGVIVKATSPEYLNTIDQCVFEADILCSFTFKVETNTSFLARAFTECPEPRELVYERAIKVWGERSQLEMLQEEATELALATRKYIRVDGVKERVEMYGELADVEIMIEQFNLMYPEARKEIEKIKLSKVARLSKRIDNNSF